MEHRARRSAFGSQMAANGVAVLFTAPTFPRNGDVHHEFRFDSDFFYLTGFAEPDAVAVLRPGHAEQPYVLFVRPRDPEREIWDGRRAGVEGAVSRHSADAAYPVAELAERLPALIENHDTLYFALGRFEPHDAAIHAARADIRRRIRTGVRAPRAIVEPGAILHEMRLQKEPAEVAALRLASEISAVAHTAAMREARPGMHEYEVQAILEYQFRKGGSPRNGYPCIVGAGANATILHYTENTGRIAPGELLLIDAGCEIEGYSADITRTFPVGGRFSAPQRAIYEAVLDAQQRAIAASRPGVRFNEIHDVALRALVEGMVRIGLLAGEPEKLIADETYKRYFMHRTGHWLGMDVHDVGAYKPDGEWRALAPGMVMTVEPGIYVAADAADAPARFRGIGVRIEDDVLITEGGCEVLTAGVPKTVAEIEALTAR